MITRILLPLLLCAGVANAAFVQLSVTFTNRTQIGDTFTRNGVTVRWTNAPLNSSSWITTNNPAGSATNLWNHLGANMGGGRWIATMTSPTNLTIKGDNAQFSITGTYAIITTNSTTPTNGVALTLNGDYTDPLKYHTETNKTNFASEILVLLKKKTTADLRAYYLSNELYLATRRSGGSDTNVFVTNAPSIQATNVTAGKITATSGELNGVNVTSAPVVTATSGRIDSLQVFTGATITNLAVPGSGLNSAQIGSGADASGSGAVAFGNNSFSGGIGSVALGTSAEAYGDFSVSIGAGNQAYGDWSFAGGANSVAGYDYSFVYGDTISADRANQFKIGTDLTVTGEIEGQSTARFANIVRARFSGPLRTDEGAYSSLTGFSNNIVQLSTNPVTRLSGATGNYNVNSLRFADGIEAANRIAIVINDTSYTATIIDSALDGFETQATNRIRCGGVNLTLAAGASAVLKYGTSYSRWELLTPSPLAAFSLSGTTNQVSFAATNSAPASTVAPTHWISVQVSGDTNAFRVPLFR